MHYLEVLVGQTTYTWIYWFVIGANDYVSTSEWLEVASTTVSLNHGTYAGFEPGLWLIW